MRKLKDYLEVAKRKRKTYGFIIFSKLKSPFSGCLAPFRQTNRTLSKCANLAHTKNAAIKFSVLFDLHSLLIPPSCCKFYSELTTSTSPTCLHSINIKHLTRSASPPLRLNPFREISLAFEAQQRSLAIWNEKINLSWQPKLPTEANLTAPRLLRCCYFIQTYKVGRKTRRRGKAEEEKVAKQFVNLWCSFKPGLCLNLQIWSSFVAHLTSSPRFYENEMILQKEQEKISFYVVWLAFCAFVAVFATAAATAAAFAGNIRGEFWRGIGFS